LAVVTIQNEKLPGFMQDAYRREDVERLVSFLEAGETFRFHCPGNGLYPAVTPAAGRKADDYRHVWVRDNVHIAHAHYVWGDTGAAVRTVTSLMAFLQSQRGRMRQIIRRPALAAEPVKRPHIRFDGTGLKELKQRWPHAQNDALGYFLWLFCRLAKERLILCGEPERQCLNDLIFYLKAIRYWEDPDSGHWEENRKVSASSIGTVMAGLRALSALRAVGGRWRASSRRAGRMDAAGLADLTAKGEAALQTILPYESRGAKDAERRRYDAALLFLIYPLEVVSGQLASQILTDVRANLEGPYGVRRYRNDSYWCADYRSLFLAKERAADFSENLQARNALIRPGEEAQWCLFDPVIACIYGRRVLENPDDTDSRYLQTHYLNRALSQLTAGEGEKGALLCPEAYFLENGIYIPNDNTPLQWTMANLRLALHWLKLTAP
jgi:hypothetical protein